MSDKLCAHGKSMKFNCLDCLYDAATYENEIGIAWAKVGPELLSALESARLLITHIEMDAYGTTYDRQWMVDALAKARSIVE